MITDVHELLGRRASSGDIGTSSEAANLLARIVFNILITVSI